jgi:hypothetical protein
MNIGSFGDKPVFVKKQNKDGAETRVTVPVVEHPVTAQYVGKDIASEIVTMQKQAKAWLDDWNKRAKQKQVHDDLPPMPEMTDEPSFI